MAFNDNDVISVKYICSSKPANENVSLAINQMHYNAFSKVGLGATEQEVADGFSQALSLRYGLLFNPTSKFEGVIVQRVHPLPLGAQFKSTVGNQIGARPFETLPFQVCGALTKLTPFGGRKYRGRVYVPFPTEDDQTAANEPSANYLNLILALGGELIASRVIGAINVTSFQAVLFHGGTPPNHITAITGIQNRLYWTSQRRRNNAWRADVIPVP